MKIDLNSSPSAIIAAVLAAALSSGGTFYGAVYTDHESVKLLQVAVSKNTADIAILAGTMDKLAAVAEERKGLVASVLVIAEAAKEAAAAAKETSKLVQQELTDMKEQYKRRKQ